MSHSIAVNYNTSESDNRADDVVELLPTVRDSEEIVESNGVTTHKKRRRTMTIAKKIEIIDHFMRTSNVAETERAFNIDRKMVRRYVTDEEPYRKLVSDRTSEIRKRRM